MTSRRGVWVWKKASWMEAANRDVFFDFLKKHGLSVILVQIETDYSGETPVLKYREQLKALLEQATRQGVIVHALDGDPGFIYPPWPEKLAGQIRAISEFNATLSNNVRFAGVHYDIEPYALEAFKKDETRLDVCKAYLTALQTLARTARAQGLEFSVDIPFWFGSSERLKPFTAQGTGTLLEHVAHIVDWFGIMAYRNIASGEDGILAHSEEEINIMEELGKKAWIGVELGPNKGNNPPKITFWNRPPAECDREIKEVESQMAARKGYGGLLIHSYEHYREYLNKASETKP